MGDGHPGLWLWNALPDVTPRTTGGRFDPDAYGCNEVDVAICPNWLEDLHALTDAIRGCCVHYEFVGDHGPNSNSYFCLLIKEALCLSVQDVVVGDHETEDWTMFGAVGCGYNWREQFCAAGHDETCNALCSLLG
jgi:hypothetical protein